MISKSKLLFIPIFLHHLAGAQIKISGTVSDASGNPLQGVTVTLLGKNLSVMTQSNGLFEITPASIPSDRSFPRKPAEAVRGGFAHGNLKLSLSRETDLGIALFDMAGNRVADIFQGRLGSGDHHLPMGGNRFAQGLYVLKVNGSPMRVALLNNSFQTFGSDPVGHGADSRSAETARSKSAAAVDTLEFEKVGYVAQKVAIDSYTKPEMLVKLDADSASHGLVSRLLFGVCSGSEMNPQILRYMSEWVEVIRWPGGSVIETFNAKYTFRDDGNQSEGANASIGNYGQVARKAIGNHLEFLVGVPSSLSMANRMQIQPHLGGWLKHPEYQANGIPTTGEYASELVTYLNLKPGLKYGNNPVLAKPLGVTFIEIGNEPDWMFNNDATAASGLRNAGMEKQMDTYIPAYREGATALHKTDPVAKVLGPSFMKPFVGNGGVSRFLQANGDLVDIVSLHRYDTDPKTYRSDIKAIREAIAKYGKDNARRKKGEIGLAYTEYNERSYNENSWAKAMWLAETFGIFIEEGLYFASLWHIDMPNTHKVYETISGTVIPLVSHYVLKFYKENLEFDQQPRVVASPGDTQNLRFISIRKNDGYTVFVQNVSRTGSEKVRITAPGNGFQPMVTIARMIEGKNGGWVKGVTDRTEVAQTNGAIEYTFAPASLNAVHFKN